MVKFKGKFFRQFLPSKPIRFGFKLFTLAESKSGYIWNFEIYTGRKGEAEENQTKKVVVRLMNPLEDKGYRLFTDNFYSSPDLFFTEGTWYSSLWNCPTKPEGPAKGNHGP